MFHSLLLGVVQGIAEFLPISSSAHLVILPYLFGWSWSGLTFDVALHFGTLFAIIIFFWRDWLIILKSGLSLTKIPIKRNYHPSLKLWTAGESTNQGHTATVSHLAGVPPKADRQYHLRGDERNYESKASQTINDQLSTINYPKHLLWMILLATVPGVLAGYFLEGQAATIFRSPLLIAVMLAVFGIIIWLIDKYSKKGIQLSVIDYRSALLIGLCQALAIIPGVSRSGATMAAGRIIGLDRQSAARFSFLLSAPIIFGSAVFEARHLTVEMLNTSLILAFLASAIFGFFAIKYLLKYLEKGGFGIFAIYRLILAIVVIAVYLVR